MDWSNMRAHDWSNSLAKGCSYMRAQDWSNMLQLRTGTTLFAIVQYWNNRIGEKEVPMDRKERGT